MCIELSYEKEIVNGEPCYRVTKVKALRKNVLPPSYLRKFPFCYEENPNKLQIYAKDVRDEDGADALLGYIHVTVRKGDVLTERELKSIQKRIKKCGKRLARINKKNKKKAEAGWEGQGNIEI
mgnify:CR=1 FL=1